jgi:hypothetical protein
VTGSTPNLTTSGFLIYEQIRFFVTLADVKTGYVKLR